MFAQEQDQNSGVVGTACPPENVEFMIESTTSTPQERTDFARQLSAAIGADAVALGGALFEMLDRVDVLLALKDAAQGRYVHVNRRMAELLGRSAED